MSFLHIFLVAIIQGITEFLPVSSSGHLILLPNLTGLEDQGLAVDVAVHVGTLGAVVLFFWKDVKLAVLGLPHALRGHRDTPGSKLAFLLILSTIPVILFGLFLSVTGLSDAMRSIKVIGWAMLGFGLVLYWLRIKLGRDGPKTASTDWTLKRRGCSWVWRKSISLIPGTSRSGITITAARYHGVWSSRMRQNYPC